MIQIPYSNRNGFDCNTPPPYQPYLIWIFQVRSFAVRHLTVRPYIGENQDVFSVLCKKLLFVICNDYQKRDSCKRVYFLPIHRLFQCLLHIFYKSNL